MHQYYKQPLTVKMSKNSARSDLLLPYHMTNGSNFFMENKCCLLQLLDVRMFFFLTLPLLQADLAGTINNVMEKRLSAFGKR